MRHLAFYNALPMLQATLSTRTCLAEEAVRRENDDGEDHGQLSEEVADALCVWRLHAF